MEFQLVDAEALKTAGRAFIRHACCRPWDLAAAVVVYRYTERKRLVLMPRPWALGALMT